MVANFLGKMGSSRLLLILLVICPVLMIIFYAYLVASDRYESHAIVYITEEKPQSSIFDLSLVGIPSTGNMRDILVLKSFIQSHQMMDGLDSDLGLLDHFSATDKDFYSRLTLPFSKEEAQEHYLERVNIELDSEAKLLKISVQSYEASYSQKILESILKKSQRFIDELNQNMTGSQLRHFEAAVEKSEQELLAINRELVQFQKQHKIFSTEMSSQLIASTISNLEQQLAAKQAQKAARQGALDKDAPTIRRIDAQIEALKEQIESENERLAGGSGLSLSELDNKFREIKLIKEYRTLKYKSNLEAFEKVQLETARRLRFLTVVQSPTLPDSSQYPNRIYLVVTGALVAIMFYFIVSISVAIFREHA